MATGQRNSNPVADAEDVALALAPQLATGVAQLGLPLVGVLFHGGLLGGAVGVLAAIATSSRGRAKLEALEERVTSALRALAMRQDMAEADAEDVSRRVDQLRDALTDAQRQDLGEVVEQTLRSADEEWLAFLRNAAADVVAAPRGNGSRHVALRRLRDLMPAHVRALQRLAARPAEFTDKHVGLRKQEPSADQEVLIAEGFAKITVNVSGGGGGGRASIAPAQRVVQTDTLRVTSLGHMALRLLSPPPLPPDGES